MQIQFLKSKIKAKVTGIIFINAYEILYFKEAKTFRPSFIFPDDNNNTLT